MDKHQTFSLGYELIRPMGTKGTKMLKETTKTKTPAERMVEHINKEFRKYRESEITISDYHDAIYGNNMPLRNKLVRLGFIEDKVIPNPAMSDSTKLSRFLEEMNGIKDVDKKTKIDYRSYLGM